MIARWFRYVSFLIQLAVLEPAQAQLEAELQPPNTLGAPVGRRGAQ